jgi:hypothetical protein
MRKLIANKKGIFGFDTTKVFIVSILTIAVLMIAGVLALSVLRDSAESVETLRTGQVNNETITLIDNVVLAKNTLRNCLVSPTASVVVTNATDGLLVASANYSFLSKGCYIDNTTSTAGVSFSGKSVNVSYPYTYNSAEANNIVLNMSYGGVSFFKQSSTFFTLFGVLVLILIIAIVIVSVTRFEGKEGRDSNQL